MDLTCPYCGEKKSIELPGEKSVAIAVCLHCAEVIVIYKQHAIALDRNVLATGSVEEKREHIASMILEFAQKESGSASRNQLVENIVDRPECTDERFCMELLDSDRSEDGATPITARELGDFRRIDLNLIDNSTYFDHVFGETG